MAVKWKYFRFLLGSGDEDAERVYRWHIEARVASNRRAGLGMDAGKPKDAAVYLQAAKALLGSMVEKGFDAAYPIPVDPDGELLGGAHRLACALALEIESVPVIRHQQKAWAPPWNYAWFVENGMKAVDLERLREDWGELHGLRQGR